MNQSEAFEIYKVWAKWCYPYHQLLFSVFQSDIPESYLPYPKQILEEALNAISEIYFNSGKKELSNAIQNTIPFLLFYKDDETALKNSAFCFSIPQMPKTLGDSITRFKNEWMEWIKKKNNSSNSNNNPDAINKTSSLLELNRRNSIQYYNKGVEKYDIKDYLGAIQDHTKALELNPKNAYAYFGRADAKSSLNDHLGAIQDNTKAIELNPKFAEAYFNRGNGKNILKDYSGAIQDFTKAIELNPKFIIDAYINRGRAKDLLKDYLGAIQDYTKAIDLDPKLTIAYYNRGGSKIELGDKDGACLDFRRASELGDNRAKKRIEECCK